jgi:hypothetical protein
MEFVIDVIGFDNLFEKEARMARIAVRRGFTVIDLIVVVFSIGLLGAVVVLITAPAMAPRGCGSRQLRDSMQVRGIHQAMVVWAHNNKDQYPLPSLIDVENATVAEEGAAKDTTANILSMLVYNGSIGNEMLFSPAEASGSISLCETYEFEQPKGAVDPAKAQWDPKLRADFTSGEGGHVSYAHLLPSGERLKKWGNSFNADDAILGNRGPQVYSVTYDKRGLASPVLDQNSTTHLIHGSRVKWEGNIAFNDNHVEFVNEPKAGTFVTGAGAKREDLLFYDEPDDASARNHVLSIFIKAGPALSDFKPIWD